MNQEKLERLIRICRLYYEENQTQNEIAKALGVSRPLISRLLREARDAGIVTVQIHVPGLEDKNEN